MSDIIEQIKDTRATSGSVSSSFGTNSGYKLVLEWKRNSVDIANNKSNVTVTAYLQSSGSSYTINSSATKNGSFTINNTKYSFTFSASLSGSQKKQIASKTVDITHNSDGTKSFSLACTAGIQITFSSGYVASVSTSGTATLDTIPRTSSITVTGSVEAGKAVTVTINRASSSFTHKVYYTFGSKSATISTSATTSASYTIPIDHCSVIPNSTSGTATIRCETFNGSTKIGETSKTFTITVPSSVVPTFTSITSAVVDAGASTSFGYVQGKSKAKLTINGATGAYGSTIKSYKIWGGASGTTNPFTTGTLTSSGTATFNASVTDSRGRTSATKSVSITINAYHAPKITSWSVIRCNDSGTAQADGTYVKCTYNATIASLGSKNAKAYTIRTYQGSTQTASANLSNTNYSISGSVIYGGYATDKSYVVQLEVKDSFSTTIQKVQVNTAYMTMDFKKGGKGVAIGKVAETDNLFDVNMTTRVRAEYGLEVKRPSLTTGCAVIHQSGTNDKPEAVIGVGKTDAVDGADLAYIRVGVDRLEYTTNSGANTFSIFHSNRNLVFNNTTTDSERRITASGTNAGMYWNRDGRIGMYDWNGNYTLFNYTSSTKRFLLGNQTYCKHVYPDVNNTYDFGSTSLRWKTLYAVNALNTSDESYKENINYLGKSKSRNNVTHEDLHEFYRSRYKIATYNYKEQEHTEYGFITQDMYEDKVGETLIVKDEENGDMYSIGSYISSVAGALQYEINLRDKQIEKLENRLEKLEKLLESFVITLDEE